MTHRIDGHDGESERARHGVPRWLGVAFALGVPLLPLSRWEDEFASVAHLVRYEATWWAIAALVIAWALRAERMRWSTLGVRRTSTADLLAAIAGAAVLLAGFAALYAAVLPALGIREDRAIRQLLATPLWWRIVSVIRAAACEELLYRGYGLERLAQLTRSRPLAALVTWAAFTLAHVGTWGWGHVLVAGFGGAVLTALYLWRRHLVTNVIAHAIVDGVAVLLGP